MFGSGYENCPEFALGVGLSHDRVKAMAEMWSLSLVLPR
jgi:hypothetical protein